MFVTSINIVPLSASKGVIIFVHGACARMQQFSNQIEYFKEAGYEISAYDALGCGLSDKPVGSHHYTSEALYLDMCEFVNLHTEANNRKARAIIGHSMGGAMVLKLGPSTLVESVVAIAPVVFHPGRSVSRKIFELPASILWLIRPLMGLKAREMLFGPGASSLLIRQEKEASARNPVHMFRAFYLGIDPTFFPVTRPKSLVLTAEFDKICPSEGGDHQLKSVGHQCMQEDPDQVNEFIIKFLM